MDHSLPQQLRAQVLTCAVESAPLAAWDGEPGALARFWRAELPTEWLPDAIDDLGLAEAFSLLAALERADGAEIERHRESRPLLSAIAGARRLLVAGQEAIPPATWPLLSLPGAGEGATLPPVSAGGATRAWKRAVRPWPEARRREAARSLSATLRADLESLRRLGTSDARAVSSSLQACFDRVGATIAGRDSPSVSLAAKTRLSSALASAFVRVEAPVAPVLLALEIEAPESWVFAVEDDHAADIRAGRALLLQVLPGLIARRLLTDLEALPVGVLWGRGGRALCLITESELGAVHRVLERAAQGLKRWDPLLFLRAGLADMSETGAPARAFARAGRVTPVGVENAAPILGLRGSAEAAHRCSACGRDESEGVAIAQGRDAAGHVIPMPCSICAPLAALGRELPRARWLLECHAPASDRPVQEAWLSPLGESFPCAFALDHDDVPRARSPERRAGWMLAARLQGTTFLPADGQGPPAGYRVAEIAGRLAGLSTLRPAPRSRKAPAKSAKTPALLMIAFDEWADTIHDAPAQALERALRAQMWWSGVLEHRATGRLPLENGAEILALPLSVVPGFLSAWYHDLRAFGLHHAARALAAGVIVPTRTRADWALLSALADARDLALWGQGRAVEPGPALAIFGHRVALGAWPAISHLADSLVRAIGYHPETLKSRTLPLPSVLNPVRALILEERLHQRNGEDRHGAQVRFLRAWKAQAGVDHFRRRAIERLARSLESGRMRDGDGREHPLPDQAWTWLDIAAHWVHHRLPGAAAHE